MFSVSYFFFKVSPHILNYGRVDEATKSLKFPLSRPCDAGEQCFLSYGKHPGSHLVTFYGFLPRGDNPYDVIPLGNLLRQLYFWLHVDLQVERLLLLCSCQWNVGWPRSEIPNVPFTCYSSSVWLSRFLSNQHSHFNWSGTRHSFHKQQVPRLTSTDFVHPLFNRCTITCMQILTHPRMTRASQLSLRRLQAKQLIWFVGHGCRHPEDSPRMACLSPCWPIFVLL